MKQKLSLILVFLSGIATLSAQTDWPDILKTIDRQVSYLDSDFSAEYTLVQEHPSKGTTTTVCALFRRDASEQYVILVQKPEESKGQGYLKQGETLWFYDPSSRRFNSSSARDRFQNSNARNSDFTRSTLSQDYRVVSESEGTLGRHTCRILELEATTDAVTYPFMKLWVSSGNLVLKTEDYSLSRQHLRTTLIPSYQQVGSKFIPTRIILEDQLSGGMVNGVFVKERTTVTIAKPSLSRLPEYVFSKTFLESVNR